jgi:quercetin dioxygenase-like cupin family protein
MKVLLKGVLVASALAFLTAPALAEDAKAPAPKAAAAKAKAAAFVTMAPGDLKWVPNPANADVQMAVLWGDPAKGAHGAFHKFKAGLVVGLHSHPSDHRIAVISGTLVEGPEGGSEKKLPAGSYVFQPHGVKHTTSCDAASECVIFVTASGPFGLAMAEAPKK